MGQPATFRVDITSAYKRGGMSQAERDLRQFGRTVNRVANVLGAALVIGGAKAVQSASDLAEAANATNVVFGDAATKIQDFGKQAAETVGLSNREFQSLATKTGSLLQNFGYSADEAATSTVTLAERAADMASVFNTSVPEALAAIEAGFRGQGDQLLNYGVTITAAKVQTKAMEMGLADATGAIDENAKALAVEALILEQTSGVAGDFANTSDSLANQQRTLGATLENLSAELGQALIPYATRAVEIFSDFASWALENQTALGALIGTVAGFVVIVKTLNVLLKAYRAISTAIRVATIVWTYAQWALNLAMTANPLGLIIAAIVAVIAIIGTLIYINRDKLIPIFKRVWDWVKQVADTLKNALGAAFDWVKDRIQSVIDFIQRFIDKIRGAADFVKDKLSFLPGIGSASVTVGQTAFVSRAVVGPATTTTPTINVTIQTGVGDPAAIARAVRRTLAVDARRTGWTLA